MSLFFNKYSSMNNKFNDNLYKNDKINLFHSYEIPMSDTTTYVYLKLSSWIFRLVTYCVDR